MASTGAHRWRAASTLLAALAVVLLLLRLATIWRPLTWSIDRGGVGMGGGWFAVGWSPGLVGVSWDKVDDLPVWAVLAQFVPSPGAPPQATTATILLEPSSSWRPSVGRAAVSMGTVSTSVDVFWLPAWWPPMIVAPLAAFAWWRAIKAPAPGHCPRCGYSLAGLAPRSACPECGVGP